ncbi:putative monooxygenase [Mycena sanguinolenta]|uniref:Putative monooxygenase n=1 Tax=Mycena sanguinolenta TaxID=230812 RepID=A0A8H6ZFT6_9AGAR|nr:putative monooxygenase [Mycena sanguinolenta]
MSGSLPTAILVAAVVSAGYLFWKSAARSNNVPAGPRRWPLIGSVLEIPQTYQWLTFSKWAKTYGSIVYADVLGQPFIIINSAKVANELLDKRSSIYSNRPNLTMATLVGSTNSFGLQSYNENWRQQRKIVAQDFSPSAVRRYCSLQETEARKLVHGLLDDPSTLANQTQLRIGAIILRIVYGHSVTDVNDSILTAGLAAMEIFSKATTPGVWAVDVLPILRHSPSWLPGSGFLRIAKKWRKTVIDATWDPYLWCKKNLATGTVLLPNLCAEYLAEADGNLSEDQEDRLAWAAASVMGGGLDTASQHLFDFDVLPRYGIKSVGSTEGTGGNRQGIAHGLSQDDIYDGMHLPKGSLVVPNVWHMLHDPEVFPNPMEFDPDRYQGLDSEMKKVTDISFGFGRRACPGRYFAEGTLFAVISTLLATCEILPTRDVEGNAVLPNISYTSGTVTFPAPFACDIKCRSQKALDLLIHGYTDDEAL